MPIDVIVPSHTYNGIGFCIYCGARDGELTEEHIVPFGLRGRWVLPFASCKKCECVTGRLENDVLQKLFGNFRYKTGAFPARKGKGKKRRTTFRLHIESEDASGPTIDIPVKNFPLCLFIPFRYGPPLLFPEMPDDDQVWRWIDDDELKRFVEDRKKEGVATGSFLAAELDLRKFYRMLAKAAHAYAYAVLSPASIEEFSLHLNDIILVGSGNITPYIGAAPGIEPPSKFMNDIRLDAMRRGTKEYLVSRVRILSPLSTPTFFVIVGERDITASTPPPLLSQQRDA